MLDNPDYIMGDSEPVPEVLLQRIAAEEKIIAREKAPFLQAWRQAPEEYYNSIKALYRQVKIWQIHVLLQVCHALMLIHTF